MDKKMEFCATLPKGKISECIPPTMLTGLLSVQKSKSVPWLGLFLGNVFPLPYVINSSVTIETTDWEEPALVWLLLHMPSGTRKSVIYKYIKFITSGLEDDGRIYQICESTFEKLGLTMQANNGKTIWFFDEARHFFSQLGLYQKGSSRDESVLLSLYDCQNWDHSTAKGVSFEIPKTNLSIGGLTQTDHVIDLFAQQEQMSSGLIPRFITVMLEPVHTPLKNKEKAGNDFAMQVNNVIKQIKTFHDGRDIHYTLLENSKGYDIYAIYHDKVIDWIVKNQYKPHMQNAICMVSKSLGHVLRLAGCLNALFLFWSVDEVDVFEKNSEYEGNSITFSKFFDDGPESLSTTIPISIMSIQCAINVIVFALTQNMKLQGIESLKFNLTQSISQDSFFSEITTFENDIASTSSSTSSKSPQTSQSTTAGAATTDGWQSTHIRWDDSKRQQPQHT